MNLKHTTLLMVLAIGLAHCSKSKTNTPTMTGNDKDNHGCIGSAGYQWSEVKNECIRLFEKGVRLDPQLASLDQTVSAFVVFKATEDDAKAELFVPGRPTAILNKKPGDEAGTWVGVDYTLTYWKGMYSLEDKAGALLYQGGLK
jgi:hypothetical protein